MRWEQQPSVGCAPQRYVLLRRVLGSEEWVRCGSADGDAAGISVQLEPGLRYEFKVSATADSDEVMAAESAVSATFGMPGAICP